MKKYYILFSILEFSNTKIEKALNIIQKNRYDTLENLSNDDEFFQLMTQEEYHNFIKNKNKILKMIDDMEKENIFVLTVEDKEYPNSLRELEDAPRILFAKGDISLLNTKSLAVVGTRMPSNYGIYATNKITEDVAKAGITIISGLAFGVDSLAHKKALEVGGKTIAVLGGGFNHIYPEAHTNLSNEIAEKGLLISEYAPTTRPTKYSFPRRNRIISGLSNGILITEAGIKSGTIHTKEYAISYGRDLFAVPGNINSAKSELPNTLIKTGQAECVLSGKDILDFYGIDLEKKTETALSLNFEEQIILNILKDGEQDFDELAKKSNISVNILNSYLTTLEIRGLIKRMPSKTFMLN